jgi:spore coat protein CotH
MDVDGFLRYLAANTLMASLDSYFGTGHNYFLHLNPQTDKFTFIPCDFNLSFGGMNLGGTPEQLLDLSIRKPHLGKNKLTERLLAIKEYDTAYRGHLKALLDKTFNPKTMNALIDDMTKLTAAAIAAEAKLPTKGGGFPMFGAMFGKTPDLKPFIAKRAQSVAAQLAGTSAGKELPGFGFGPGGGMPFGPPKKPGQ